MTTTPSPIQLAEALTDVALGYTAELVGAPSPDPILGRRLLAHAKRVASRIHADDPRLEAFAPFTGENGYTWLPEESRGAYLEDQTNAHWSFERWFSGLAETCKRIAPHTAEQLADMETFDAAIKPIQDQGFRIREFVQDDDGFSGFIMTNRPQP